VTYYRRALISKFRFHSCIQCHATDPVTSMSVQCLSRLLTKTCKLEGLTGSVNNLYIVARIFAAGCTPFWPQIAPILNTIPSPPHKNVSSCPPRVHSCPRGVHLQLTPSTKLSPKIGGLALGVHLHPLHFRATPMMRNGNLTENI